MEKRIESAKNPLFSVLRQLGVRKGREQAGLFLAEGPKIVGEACKYARCRYIIVADGYDGPIPISADAEVVSLPARLFERLGDAKTPQGIAAAVEILPQPEGLAQFCGLLLFLERVQDPGNVGAMIRSADAAGAKAVFLSAGCADLYSPKVVRATMGSLFHLPVLANVDILAALTRYRQAGYDIVAGDLAGSEQMGEVSQKAVLLIGNEGAGLSREADALATVRYRLPIYGRAESLNAATAAGIMLYDLARRQRGTLIERIEH